MHSLQARPVACLMASIKVYGLRLQGAVFDLMLEVLSMLAWRLAVRGHYRVLYPAEDHKVPHVMV